MTILNIALQDAADAHWNGSLNAVPQTASREGARTEPRPAPRPLRRTASTAPIPFPVPLHPAEWGGDGGHTDDWRLHAECRPEDTELFYSKDAVEKRAALAICGDCPVSYECLIEALDQEDGLHIHGRYGIRGGMTPAERRDAARSEAGRRT